MTKTNYYYMKTKSLPIIIKASNVRLAITALNIFYEDFKARINLTKDSSSLSNLYKDSSFFNKFNLSSILLSINADGTYKVKYINSKEIAKIRNKLLLKSQRRTTNRFAPPFNLS